MKQLVSVVALALGLLMGSSAMARDGDGRRFDRGHSYRHDYRGHRDFDRRFHGDRKFDRDRKFFDGRRYDDRRRYDRRFDRKFDGRKFDGRKFDDRRFYGERKFSRDRYSYRSWRRGDRLPRTFLSTRFVVKDYGRFGLYGPPRGYRWVRVERDAFLAGIATGVIIGVAADRFY